MRVVVNCTGGASHSMMLLEHTTVHHVKAFVEDKEGVPVNNQALLFAGRELAPDDALLLHELHLDSYSLAHEVVVYMRPRLSQPLRVYLSGQPGSSDRRMFPELVEANSTLSNIQELLAQRQLCCMPFSTPVPPCSGGSSCNGGTTQPCSSDGCRQAAGSSSVVVKRQDGSCCSKVCVDEAWSINGLLEAIWDAEGCSPTSLLFYQAKDGCLHAVYGAEASVQ